VWVPASIGALVGAALVLWWWWWSDREK
jgi:hypothetical protein